MGDPFRGVGVCAAARAGVRGRVVSVHRRAVYLDLDGPLIAVVAAGVEPGPVHLHGGPLPPAVAGERVTCDGSRLAARTWAVRCDVPTWVGVLPDPWSAGHDARGRTAPDRRPEARTTIPADVPVDPEPIEGAVRDGAIEDLAGVLGGRGPGLTPAGDDLLAGLVLAARAGWGADAEPRLVAAVGRVRTTRPSQTFLHWAARGQSLAPAHDVLAGDPGAGARLEAIGASSGRCLLAGLRMGVAQLPRLDTQRTRAGPVVAL